jgi:uncharacterized membrane protein
MVDFLRGAALILMALDHAAYYTKTGLMAECYWETPITLESWPHWTIGLVSNVAAPIFWFVSGISLALYITNRRQKNVSERSISGYFLIRAAILLFLDQVILRMLWGDSFNVLSSIAVSILIVSSLRFLPLWVTGAGSLALLLGYDALWSAIPVPRQAPGNFWLAMWISPTTFTHPDVVFPILGWISLMGLGFVTGNLLSRPAFRQARTWFIASGVCLAGWLICQVSGFGTTNSCISPENWLHVLIMSKSPPSLAYKLFNMGIAFSLFGASTMLCDELTKRPFDWVRVCGQATLFFYVLHVVIYRVIGPISLQVLPLPGIVRGILVWVIGLGILLPLSIGYRRIKERHPGSVLRYL